MPIPKVREALSSKEIGLCTSIGILLKVIYRKEEGWGIYQFTNLYRTKQITALGIIPQPILNGQYRLEGRFEKDEKRREWQLKFTGCEAIFDTTELGVVNYLKLECPNIGEQKAKQLYAIFGVDTLSILENYPEKAASQCKGLSLEYAHQVSEFLKKEKGVRDTKEKLYSIGLTPWQTNAIIKVYGHDAENKIRADCFQLTEIKGLGFKKVSLIADNLNIPRTDARRIRAAIKYAMEEFADFGHICVLGHDLIVRVQKMVGIEHLNVEDEIQRMLLEKHLLSEDTDPGEVIQDASLLYDTVPTVN